MKIVSKLTIFLLSLLMFLNTLSVNIIAENNEDVLGDDPATNEKQICSYYDGTTEQELGEDVANPDVVSYENDDIVLIKTISPTNTENKFNIDLKVLSKNKADHVFKAEDAAVVLCLDMSTSLYKDKPKDYRFDIISCCKSFIENFGNNSLNKKRYIAVVTFWVNVNTVDWIDVSNESIRTNFINQYFSATKVSELNSIFNKDGGPGTNTSGGLEFARQYLEKTEVKDIKNKYVILMTDGNPNSICIEDNNKKITSKTGKYYSGTTDVDAWHKQERLAEKNASGVITKKWYELDDFRMEDGSQYSLNKRTDVKGDPGLYAAALATEVSRQIRNENKAEVFAIGFGDDLASWTYDPPSSTESNYNPDNGKYTNALKKDGASVDENGVLHSAKIGREVYTGCDWLKYDIVETPDKYYDSKDSDDIKLAFDSIYDEISNEVTAWIVTDPMGKDIVLGDIYKADGTKINPTDYEKNGISLDGETINWDLKSFTPKEITTDSGKRFQYEIKYDITLNNLTSDFKSSNIYKTNGTVDDSTEPATKIRTNVLYAKYTSDTEQEVCTGYFNIPSVKGYLAGDATVITLPFTKTDDLGQSLSGAEFKLTTSEDPNWSMTVTSGEDGKVTFTDVPSGHDYILQETKAPSGHILDTETYSVKVHYGVVKIFDSEEKEITNEDFKIENVPKTRTVNVVKIWDDAENQDGYRPGEIIVNIYRKSTGSAELVEGNIKLNSENNWSYTKTDLLVDDIGGNKYTYYVRELNASGIEIEEDEKYNEHYTVSYGDLFTIINTHKPETKSIKITKVWDDSAIAGKGDYSRPEEIYINIYGKVDGETVYEEENVKIEKDKSTLTDSNTWEYTVNDLPAKDKGKDITYSITENKLSGFSTTVTDFKIENTINVEYVVNSKEITLKKYDSKTDTKTGLEGAEFTLSKNSANDSSTYTTDENGEIKIAFAEEGTYTLVETKAPEGYKLDEKPTEYTFSVTKNQKSVTYDTEKDKWIITYDIFVECNPSTDYSDGVLIVKNEPETTSVTVNKEWIDSNNQDGIRPISVTINLLADGEKVNSTTLNDDNNWSDTFSDLLKYKDGTAIKYTIDEEEVTGYVTTYDKDNPFKIINTHEPSEITLNYELIYQDHNDYDKVRPEKVYVQLYEKNSDDSLTYIKEVELTEAGTGSFTELPEYKDGSKINYVIRESDTEKGEPIEDGKLGDYYTVTYDETTTAGKTTITNIHEPITSKTVTKTWDDADNQDGKRPTSITVDLYKSIKGEEASKVDGKTATITAAQDGSWSYEYKDLPVFDGDDEITYSVKETAVTGYVTTYDKDNPFKIINTYSPTTVDINVVIEWNDSNDKDGLRPSEVEVQLYKLVEGDENPSPVGNSTTINSSTDDWKHSFEELPEYEDGKTITYSVKELGEDEEPKDTGEKYNKDYDVESYKIEGNTTTITNKHESTTVSLTVTKVWDDNNDVDELRPQSIDVELLDDAGKQVGSATLNEDNKWTYTFTKLSKDVKYTVQELDVPSGYVARYGRKDDVVTITNTLILEEKTSITVNKIWEDRKDNDGYRPDSVNVTLYANGLATLHSCVLNEDNDWSYTFIDLPVYDFDNKAITYSVVEDVVEHYTTDYFVSKDGFTVTNTHAPETKDASVTVIWNDGGDETVTHPNEVTVKLYKTVDGESKPFIGEPIVVTEEDGYSKTIKDLPKYENGKEITYSFTEFDENLENELEPHDEFNDDYDLDSYDTYNDHTDIINIHTTGEEETTSITVTKVWNDNDNIDGIRPGSIEIQLLANGEEYGGPVTLSSPWSYTFAGLPKKSDDKDIIYTVKEISEVEGYTTTYSDDTFTITNTHNPDAQTSIKVTKVWNDDNDREKLRPNEVNVTLYKNGVETDSSITLSDTNGWSYAFKGLEEYEDGIKNEYTIIEDSVDGYTPNYYYDEDGNLTITNIHEPETKDVEVIIKWDDNNDKEEKRPDEVIVVVYNGEEEYKRTVVTPDEDGKWEHTFEDLPVKDKDGEPITYTVKEIDVYNNPTDEGDDYNEDYVVTDYEIKPEEDTTIITNKHVPETKDVDVTIVWDDDNDSDGVRPDKVFVILYEDHEGSLEPIQEVIINENDNWYHEFKDLPSKDKNGNEIKYVVKEIDVYGDIANTGDKYNSDYVVTSYVIEYDSTTITNKYVPHKPVPPEPKPYNPPKTGIN